MKIVRAAHLGFCSGVRRALSMVLDHPGPVTILGDLVHNELVLAELKSHGVRIARSMDQLQTSTVMITAHGTSDKIRSQLLGKGLTVLEGACPLVQRVHHIILKLESQGYYPVVIGKASHVEVKGLTGDLNQHTVLSSVEDVPNLPEHARYGIVAQTTHRIEHARQMVDAIKARFPHAEIRFIDTICQPTKLRQKAAMSLAMHCDAVVVIGGAESNNTRELCATCSHFCSRVHHVQGPQDLQPAWFNASDVVGITAGTSTPDDQILAVEQKLRSFQPIPLMPTPPVSLQEYKIVA